MDLINGIIEPESKFIILNRVEEYLRGGLENEAIELCVRGIKIIEDNSIKDKLRSIMVSLL